MYRRDGGWIDLDSRILMSRKHEYVWQPASSAAYEVLYTTQFGTLLAYLIRRFHAQTTKFYIS